MQIGEPVAQPPVQTSWRSRAYACLTSKETIQCSKAIFWNVAAGGTLLIPIPILNTAIMGSMFFLGLNAALQHPDSVFMHREASRQLIASRTWKHIAAGALVCGASWGLGGLSIYKGIPYFMGIGCLGGMAGGFRIAYSNSTCMGGAAPAAYQQVQIEVANRDTPAIIGA